MPRKPGRKKTGRKKPYRRRYTRRKKNIIPSAPRNHMVVRLNYSENTSLYPGAIPAASIWRINDLYDPNFSGTGHQPYFRDQMFTLYNYGRVLWASIKVSVLTDGSAYPAEVVLAPCQNGVADVYFQTAAERKGSKECYINGNLMKVLKVKSSCDYYFGMKKGTTAISPSFLQNPTGALPNSNSMFYEVIAQSLNGTSITVYIKVDICMIVRFEEPRQQSGS